MFCISTHSKVRLAAQVPDPCASVGDAGSSAKASAAIPAARILAGPLKVLLRRHGPAASAPGVECSVAPRPVRASSRVSFFSIALIPYEKGAAKRAAPTDEPRPAAPVRTGAERVLPIQKQPPSTPGNLLLPPAETKTLRQLRTPGRAKSNRRESIRREPRRHVRRATSRGSVDLQRGPRSAPQATLSESMGAIVRSKRQEKRQRGIDESSYRHRPGLADNAAQDRLAAAISARVSLWVPDYVPD